MFFFSEWIFFLEFLYLTKTSLHYGTERLLKKVIYIHQNYVIRHCIVSQIFKKSYIFGSHRFCLKSLKSTSFLKLFLELSPKGVCRAECGMKETFQIKVDFCLLRYSEVSNNSSDLLLIFWNFFQQNRLIIVWIIINFYIVFLQNSYFRQNFGFLSQISAFWAGKSKKNSENLSTEFLLWYELLLIFRKSSNRMLIWSELLFGTSEYKIGLRQIE